MFGGSQSSSYSSATPTNLQNPGFTALADPTAGGISSFFSPNSASENALGSSFGLNPFSVNGLPSSNGSNPLVAPLTGQQNSLVSAAGPLGLPGAGNINAALGVNAQQLNPNYPASLATSPQTLQAVNAAVNPLVQAFQNTTLPGLAGQFTAAGQRVNTATANPGASNPNLEGTGPGSSAFDRANAIAGTGLQTNVASTAAGIENSAYQTGLQQQSNAVNQAQQINSNQINNLLQSLQASALPQMLQQYGINQGLQLYQSQVGNILAALGLGAQAAQPAIAYNQTGTSQATTTPSLFAGIGQVGSGVGNLASAFGLGI